MIILSIFDLRAANARHGRNNGSARIYPPRHRFRFSLKKLLLAMLLFSVTVGWFGGRVLREHERRVRQAQEWSSGSFTSQSGWMELQRQSQLDEGDDSGGRH